MDFKDYYETLGVPRDASEADLKKAFRKLARKFHPDHAGHDNPDAEERFKEVNEAYEVLSDPEKRQRYDQIGHQWRHSGGPSGTGVPPGWEEIFAGAGSSGRAASGPGGFSFNFGGTGFSDFFEAFFGGAGQRVDPFGNGRGSYSSSQPPPDLDIETDLLVTLEEANAGGQRTLTLRKTGPTASDADSATETIRVRIPPGIRQHQRIRVPGKGRGTTAGHRGDLFLRVRLERHPDFRVDDADLHHDLDLPPWGLALGTRKTIPTLAERVTITIPPGTQPGRKFRLRGLGLRKADGSRGDLFAIANVLLPPADSEASRQAWENLRDAFADPS